MTTTDPADDVRISHRTDPPPILTRTPDPVPVARHPLQGRHVAIVGVDYGPEPDGIGPYTRGMAEHLAAHATSVTVLTGMPRPDSDRPGRGYRFRLRVRESAEWEPVSGRPAGLIVRRLRHVTRGGPANPLAELTFMAHAWSVGLGPAPDLVIAVVPSLGGAVAAARIAERHDARLLVVVQDLRDRPERGAASGALERFVLRRAGQVAVVRESLIPAVLACGVPAARISLLPNWAQIEPSAASRDEARAILGWSMDPFTVVHTGTIGRSEDLATLVEAARRSAVHPDMRFVIVGAGDQRGPVQELATGLRNVRFAEPLDAVRHPLALAAADVLVMTEQPTDTSASLLRTLPSYLLAGRPIVAAVDPKGPAAQEIQQTAGAGLLVRPGAPADLALCLAELRDDVPRQLAMGARGEAYALSHLSRMTAMTRLDAVIGQTMNEAP